MFFPVLRPGYVLSLDMIFAPGSGYVDFLVHTKGPLYYGRLPFVAALDALSVVLPGGVVQKLVLVSLVAACGLCAFAACGARTLAGRLFAGTVYAVNPFVFVRLLAGHWYFLLGYAVLPLAVVRAYRWFDPDSDAPLWPAVGWATVVSVFDPHATVLLALAGGCLFAALLVREARAGTPARLRTLGRRFSTYVVACAAANAYWLLPAVVAADATRLGSISGADLAAFGARGTIAGNVPLSLGMLYGFWRSGYPTNVDLLSSTGAYLLFAVLLFLAVSGGVRSRDGTFAAGVTGFTVVAFVLAAGVSTTLTEPLARVLFETVPVLRGMRDAQKFVGLLALTYALFGGRGVDALVGAVRTRADGRLAAVCVLLVLAVPLAYAAPMLAGAGGHLETTTYPDGWHAADDALAGRTADSRVLVLPWHQYIDYSWTDGTVANPAGLFFGPEAVVGHTLEVGGVESRATDPTHVRSRRAIDDFDAGRIGAGAFAERLAPLGFEYVLVAHEADYRRYAALDDDPAFRAVLRTETVTVFENVAFEPRDEPWPRASPPVPRTSLGVGLLCSGLTGALAASRRRWTAAVG